MATRTTAEADADDDDGVRLAAPLRPLKQFGLVVLCAAWVVLGVVGHDPVEDAGRRRPSASRSR